MRILYHHRTLGDGAEGIHVASIVDAMRSLGHEVKVTAVIGEQTNVSNGRTRILEKIKQSIPPTFYELLEFGYSFYGYRMLSQLIKDWQPDLIYERYTLFNLAGILASKKYDIPIVLEVNAPLAHERAEYERLIWEKAAHASEHYICSKADKVVVVSTPLRNYFIQQGVPSEIIEVIPNAADPERFRPNVNARQIIRSKNNIASDAVVIGFVGILRPWHGVELLISAFTKVCKQCKDVVLLIVGDGPSQRVLQQLAASLGIEDKVCFTGRVSHDEIPSYLAACDIGVSPRATFYASPMKVPEYMAAGLAVVAPRITNLEDLVCDGIDGLLFEPESKDSLFQGLISLVESPELRKRFSKNARNRILQRCCWYHNAEQALRLPGNKVNDKSKV